MTGLLAAHQNGLFGERFLTHKTWFGLSHEVKRITCWASERMPGSSMGLKHEMGRWFFYRETKGSRGREWPNERRAHHAVGGEEVGGPPSPPP